MRQWGVSFSSSLGQHLDRLFPAAPGADEVRHRFSAASVVSAIAVALLSGSLFSLVNPASALVVGTFGALCVLLGVVLRVTRREAVAFWGVQILCSALFVAGAWTELGPAADWAMWLAILPLTGMLYGGSRPGLIGLVLGVCVALVIVLVPAPNLFDAKPATHLASLTRVICFLLACFILGAVWQEMRTQALDRAEAAGRARTLFLANMSHELRTPMNGVIGLADLLMASNPSPEQLQTLAVMRRSGQQLLTLINDIIDFTRLDAGRMPLERSAVDLHRIVSDTVELIRPTVKAGGPSLGALVGPQVPRWVMGDEVRLRQVLGNLVGNAVKFTPSGKVTVEVQRSAEQLIITVSDTGVGISPEVQGRLFRPFEQADASSNRRYAGSGLGLAIARQLVERMGGRITLRSSPGQGSAFMIHLPLEEPSSAREEPMETAPGPTGGRSVLVVDDNDINLYVAVSLLKKAGYRTTTAKSGLEAVTAVASTDFDAVLMDCHMPELDGFEATRRIRRLASPRRTTPIIALTASVLDEELDRCLEAGMNTCLTKPVTLGVLMSTLSKVFDVPGPHPE